MPGRLEETALHEPLTGRLLRRPGNEIEIFWLGQAGFVIDIAGSRLVIDPYLSDSLAEKYKGTPRPHLRMMPPPVLPNEIPFVDLVLCTHAHTDHMDPGTLPSLLAANPTARLIAPRAVSDQTVERSGVHGERLILVDAGEQISSLRNMSIIPTRSAHERLDTDEHGNHRYLGYAIEAEAACLWHSGDCVPFAGLEDEITALRPDIALMPVNGRSPELSKNGVPGNFSLDEAVELARYVGSTALIAHHYGLFDFNTESPQTVDAAIATAGDIDLHRAKTDVVFSWYNEGLQASAANGR